MATTKSQQPLQVSDSSALRPRSLSSRSTFHLAYVLIWALMVLSAVGAYGLDNGSQRLVTVQLSVLGTLGLGAALVWSILKLSRSAGLGLVCYPLLYMWAVLGYAVQDERFVVRVTEEGYSGSTASAALPAAVLFLFLPDTINHRLTPCLISGLGGLGIIAAFQIAGVRANSGLADVCLALISVLYLCRRCYERKRLRHSGFLSNPTPIYQSEVDPDTWGLPEDTSSPDVERVLRKMHEVHSLLASVMHFQAGRNPVKSAMTLLLEAGKDLSSLGGSREIGSAGLVSKAVESEYRQYLEERFLPIQPQMSRPIAHPIQYGGQELIPMLSQLEKNWNFDMFFLAQVSGFRALEVTGEYCVRKYALDTNLKLSEGRVLKFLQEMERKYKPNPYHNSTHAADVMNSLLFLYKQSDIFKEITELELFGSIVAALGHDVGHPAFSNRYLMNTRSQFAMMCK